MKPLLKRICALAAALCMLCTCAAAEVGWVDDQLSDFLDINSDTTFSLGFQVNTLQPFGEDITAMINETLANIRVETRILDDGTQMGFTVAGESLFTIEEAQRDGRMAMTTSLLPNRVLVADASPMDLLSGNEMAQEDPFDLHLAISDAQDCYEALTEAIVPYATEKAANYKISGIGYARWVRLARLGKEDSAKLLPQIIRMLSCGMDQSFHEKLQTLTCADQFTVALYSDEENGTPLAVYMKGSVYLSPEDKWTLAYQWAFAGDGEETKDTYRCELVQVKSPKHKRVIEGKLTGTGTETGQRQWSLDCELAIKDDTRNQTIINKDRLTLDRDDRQQKLSGSIVTTVKDHSGGDTVTTVTTITPELTLTSAQGSGVLSGTVNLEEHQGKTVYRDLTFLLDEEPAQALDEAAASGNLFAVDVNPRDPSVAGSSLAQNVDVIWSDDSLRGFLVGNPPVGMTAYPAPETMQTIDLSLADEAQRSALLEEMAQRSAGLLLIGLGKLPGEPLRLLTDNMTDVDYAAFLSLLGDL